MEKLFVKFKRSVYIKLIVSMLLSLLAGFALLIPGVINKNVLLMFLAPFIFINSFPIFMILLKFNHNDIKDKIIKETIALANKDAIFEPYKEISDKAVLELDIRDRADYFYISNAISVNLNNSNVLSYEIKFAKSRRKKVLGRIYEFEFLGEAPKQKNIKSKYLRNANFLGKVKVLDNKVYILASSFLKDKSSKMYNIDPFAFKSYSEYKDRIFDEFDMYNKISLQEFEENSNNDKKNEEFD